MYIGFRVKVPVIFLRRSWNFPFLIRYSKNVQIYNFVKVRRSGSRVVPCRQTDGQTDVTKLSF